MKNLFLRPKVFFMLMVICLSPSIQTIQIQACPPDCSNEEAAVAAAQDEVRDKKKDLESKEENYRKSRTELQNARRNLREAREGLKKAGNTAQIRNVLGFTKVIIGLIDKGPAGAIKGAISWGAGFIKSIGEFEDEGDKIIEAREQLRERQNEFNNAKQARKDAQQALQNAQDALADAQAALEDCQDG